MAPESILGMYRRVSAARGPEVREAVEVYGRLHGMRGMAALWY